MHTLKGSGRMVGLKELGEVAWELEQTLNLWLRQDTTVTPDLQRMIDDAHTLFSTWVSHLENGQGGVPDAGALVALAGRLRGVEPAVAVPVVEIEPPVEQAAAEVVPVAPPLEVTEAPEPALPLESVVIEAPVEPEEAIPRSTPKSRKFQIFSQSSRLRRPCTTSSAKRRAAICKRWWPPMRCSMPIHPPRPPST
jgi:chemosensory pili system protein ChpA (sensor histidine kinase/response regulator)